MKIQNKAGLITCMIGSILLSACGSGSKSSAVTNALSITTLYSFGISSTDTKSPNSSLIKGSDGNFYGVSYKGGANGMGTIFKTTPTGSETVLYSFGGTPNDGTQPTGIVQGSDGNLYGTTATGGANGTTSCANATSTCYPGDGTAFMVNLAGIETVLYSFGSSSSDGINPNGGLIQASDGNLYGITRGGGANGNGSVFKISTVGSEVVLYSFGTNGSTDSKTPNAGLIQSSSGNLYGTTIAGGLYSSGTVFQITTAGVESVLYSFGVNVYDGTSPYANIIQGSDGNFYGTTLNGGASGAGTVFKLTPAGSESILYSFGRSTTDGTLPYSPVVQGSDGNFYGTTYSGGANGTLLCLGTDTSCYPGYGTLFMISPSGSETVLYSFGTGDSSSAGVYPVGGLLQVNGTFYGTATGGGTYSSGTIYSFVN